MGEADLRFVAADTSSRFTESLDSADGVRLFNAGRYNFRWRPRTTVLSALLSCRLRDDENDDRAKQTAAQQHVCK